MRLAAVAIVLAVAAVARGETALGVAETLRRAADVGPDQAVARAAVPIAAADVRTARMFPNPTIGINGGMSEPIVAGVLTLHLPILGQIGARRRAAERALEQVRLETALTLWHLRREARVAYYSAVRADDELAIALEVETLSRRVAQIAATRFDAGAGSLLEKLQAQLIDDRAQQDVIDRQTGRGVARLELARVIGEPGADLGRLADALGVVGTTPSLDDLLAAAERQHPELRALEAERFAAEARAHSARADRRPIFSVDLGVELLDPTTCNPSLMDNAGGSRCVGPRGGLSFDLPVFNLNGGPIARAEAEAMAARIKRDAAATRIRTAVRAAYATFSAAVVRSRFFDTRYVPAATQVEAMAREGFAAGRTGLLPLIEAQRSLLDSRLGQAEARFAVQQARADLEEASGVALSAP